MVTDGAVEARTGIATPPSNAAIETAIGAKNFLLFMTVPPINEKVNITDPAITSMNGLSVC
jgi:hypothetical protein